LVYNTDLFEAATINRLATHFETLLEGIVLEPETMISSLPLLTAKERDQLLNEWNQVQAEYQTGTCLHEWFEQQAQRNQSAVAVVFDQDRLTYRELNERSNQLAHYLRERNVGPDVMVGLYIERSLDLVIAILAVLKAGGAYVPLDTSYPKERLAFTFDDASIRLVLTQQKLVAALPERELEVVILDTALERFANRSTANLPNITTPENLAYLIYTSGSTGWPKGSMVTHGNVVRLFK